MPIFRFKIPCTLKEHEQEYTPPTSHDLYMLVHNNVCLVHYGG